jgi:hypothetical protein
MKKSAVLLFAAVFLGLTAPSYAEDRTGVLGLSYELGPSFIAGGSDANDFGIVQPGVNGALRLGLMRNLDFEFAYDYIHAQLRSQALTFGGIWKFTPDAEYTPFAGAGLGFGKPYTGEGWDHFSLKLNGGIERTLTPSVSLAGVMTYQYIQGGDPIGSVHAIEPAARLIYYFGNLSRR